MARVRIPSQIRRSLLDANRGVCCVCKKRGAGVNIHHIDEDPSNNDPANLAVVCVRDHDRHHRPNAYVDTHPELTVDRLRHFKNQWERTVASVDAGDGLVVALAHWHGQADGMFAVRVDFQLGRELVLERLWHVTEAAEDTLLSWVIEEVAWLDGPNDPEHLGVRLAVIDEPQPVDYCSHCAHGGSYGRTLDPAYYAMITNPTWREEALASVYVNPGFPSLAVVIFAAPGAMEDDVHHWSLHRCGKFLHVQDKGDERFPIKRRASVRTQVTELVLDLLFNQWQISPDRVIVGTGDPDKPDIVDDLVLPVFWEGRRRTRLRR